MSPHNVCFLSASPVWPTDQRRRIPLCGGLVRVVRLGRRIGQFVTRPYWGAPREGNQSGSPCADLCFLLRLYSHTGPPLYHPPVSRVLPSYISTFIPPQLLSSLSLMQLEAFKLENKDLKNEKIPLCYFLRHRACFSGGHMLAVYKSPH